MQCFLENPVRKMSAAYAAAEMLWYLSGTDDASLVKAYAPSYENFLDDGVHAYGAYGKRWKDGEQIKFVWEILTQMYTSRQAVMHCWRQGDLKVARGGTSKDVPCTLTLQFLLRDSVLHMITTMRSNDLWLGMPYDVWCFTRLQHVVAAMCDADVGWYQHQVGSLHLYEKHWAKADRAHMNIPVNPCVEAYEFRETCPQELYGATQHALAIEEKLRAGEELNQVALENLLGRTTFFSELVLRCSRKWEHENR